MIELGPPPPLFIPARPAIVRAHQGDLDALKALERERGIKAMLPGLVPLFNSRRATLALSFIGSSAPATSATTFDFGDFAVGAGNVLVVVAIQGLHNATKRTISSVSIGGAAATINTQNITAGIRPANGIASRMVPGGGSVNISVTFNGLIDRGASLGVYAITGFSSSAAYAVGSAEGSGNGTGLTASLDVPAKGVSIASYFYRGTGVIAWTGATKDFDLLDGATGSSRRSSANFTTVAAALGASLTTSHATGDLRTLECASFA